MTPEQTDRLIQALERLVSAIERNTVGPNYLGGQILVPTTSPAVPSYPTVWMQASSP